MSAIELFNAAKALPLDRAKLNFGPTTPMTTSLTKESIPDLTAEQAAELDRRLAEFEKNPRGGIPLQQVEAEIKQRFGW